MIILFVKSSEDILQGVSKLDNLLKVSVFQKYKRQDDNVSGIHQSEFTQL